jgi:hypothetical protein
MKTLIKSAIIGLALAGVAQATPTSSYVTQNVTQTATDGGTNFTFYQFNSSLGNLTAVELILQSSTIQGNFTLTRGSGTGTVTITSTSGGIFIEGAQGSGLYVDGLAIENSYASSPVLLNRTPSGNQNLTPGASSKTFSINGTSQSLISSATAVSLGSDFSLSYYSGNALSSFNYLVSTVIPFVSSSAGTAGASVSTNNALSPTSLTLRYAYTPSSGPSAVPEPGQVAASLLLLGGIGGYVFIKRGRKPAVADA